MSIYFNNQREIGFGTYPLKGAELTQAISHAYATGYRAFDTAQMYKNEADLGAAFRHAQANIEKLFITTKVHPENFTPDKFLPSVEKSLGHLGVDAVDMLLLHWPPVDSNIDYSVELLIEAKRAGYAKNVGVSNYNVAMLRRAKEIVGDEIACNQVEFHPLLDQRKLLAAAAELSIPLVAFSPIARGKIFEYPLFQAIGHQYGVNPGQVALRWIIQKGVAINVMSTNPKNIITNFDILGFELTADDIHAIDELNAVNYRVVNSDAVPWAPVWD